MTVMIRGSKVSIAGQSQNVGVFVGQNRQDGWDSISTEKIASGFNMGDFTQTVAFLSYYYGTAYDWQSIRDSDVKGNFTAHTVK